MDWTIQDFANANHDPLVVVNGQTGTSAIWMEAVPGQTFKLDVSGTSDPDKGQKLTYHWSVYPEAGLSGTHGVDLVISDADQQVATVSVKSPCQKLWQSGLLSCRGDGVAHIILTVTDDGSPRLTSYRRIILQVKAAASPAEPK